MAQIVVLRPDVAAPSPSSFRAAPRGDLPERIVIGLIANGKPFAKELLELLAAALRTRLDREAEVELIAKPSAAYSISDDEAMQLAARAHVVISGLGD
jgi:hypothetical protein